MADLKIGVYGLFRGSSHIRSIGMLEGATVCAICDQNQKAIDDVLAFCPEGVKVFHDWDSFIHSGMDVVVLANFFHQHAACAIEAMELGIDVISECTAAATMQECADLCRAVERTGRTYCLAENCPYELGPIEMRRVFRQGILGDPVYGEGEYVHPSNPEFRKLVVPNPGHWRNFLPATYYLTHSLGPLMYVTEAIPRRVIGKTAPNIKRSLSMGKNIYDGAGMMLCEMSDGSLFRFCGCASYSPHEYWTRLACSDGCCETVRGDENSVRVAFNEWNTPEGWQKENVYRKDVETEEETEKINTVGGHFGIDYRMMKDIITDLRAGRQPFFDVYKSVSMSAAAILGWRSVLNDSKQFDIPDFRSEEGRKICDGDTATPFPNADGTGDVIPCSWAKPE